MSERSDTIGIENGALAVEFQWNGDRYAHRITVATSNGSVTCLQSREGNASQVMPPSPAFQQLHAQVGPQGATSLLGVGMSGKNHWSLAVEPSSDPHELRFDVACRWKSRPHELTTEYTFGDPRVVIVSPERPLRIAVEGHAGELLIEQLPPGATEASGAWGDSGGGVRWSTTAIENTSTGTARWRYRICYIAPAPA